MINRNSVLGVCALTALMSQVAQAMPTLPDPETPPVTLQFTSTYFTNIAGSSAALATARGVKRIDELYSPSINLNLVEPMVVYRCSSPDRLAMTFISGILSSTVKGSVCRAEVPLI